MNRMPIQMDTDSKQLSLECGLFRAALLPCLTAGTRRRDLNYLDS